MVIYNPKDWWKLIFSFHKSDTFRITLPGIIGIAIYTAIIVYSEVEIFHLSFKNTTNIHALVGFALSMLLVFRTNSAYDRWWEGRKAWGGFVNSSRNFAFKISTYLNNDEQKQYIHFLLQNYFIAVKEHLRDGVQSDELVAHGQYQPDVLMHESHVPNHIMHKLFKAIHASHQKGELTDHQLLMMNAELQSFTDNLGVCERIKKTPIPYSYNLFLKKMIFIYIASMPFGFAMDFGYWSVIIIAFIFYVFASIELLAEEIEDPFGNDANDLPTDDIAQGIRSNLKQILS
jgi:putative membrane protein